MNTYNLQEGVLSADWTAKTFLRGGLPVPVYDTAPLSPFPAHHRHFQTYAIPIQGMGEVPVDEGLEHQTQARGDSYFW